MLICYLLIWCLPGSRPVIGIIYTNVLSSLVFFSKFYNLYLLLTVLSFFSCIPFLLYIFLVLVRNIYVMLCYVCYYPVLRLSQTISISINQYKEFLYFLSHVKILTQYFFSSTLQGLYFYFQFYKQFAWDDSMTGLPVVVVDSKVSLNEKRSK